MTPAQLALAAVAAALLVCARADTNKVTPLTIHTDRQARLIAGTQLPSGCLYSGRWHTDGSIVTTREECLRCTCLHGALSCRRRACAPLPDPLPHRCHVRHRRGSCCPELHCPDGVQIMEHGASARFESEDKALDFAIPTSASHACVEGGTVFAAGSALSSRVACEQCYCLRGVRRCVRPRCLPPPPHCAPRPSPGACCPQRYYCDRTSNATLDVNHQNDCLLGEVWVSEGESVPSSGNCTACFCLRGEVHCQALGCAPPLSGCRPLLALGDCCAHQYICEHKPASLTPHSFHLHNSLVSTRYEDRAFHSSKSSKLETTTKKILTSTHTSKQTPIASATKNHLITTVKVKRKTNEPPLSSSQKPDHNTSVTTSTNITTTQKTFTAAKLIALPEGTSSTEVTTERTTEQPEGTVKIMINGTINCTAELSSTSLPLSIAANDTDRIQMEAMPRIPIVNVEAQTYSPNDIITDRNVNGGFDENDTFTINVTSSLMTNTSRSTSRPVMTVSKIPTPTDLVNALNTSKKTKGDYDYDYTEPTLPPSLPNLKIIPFVAADAVVDDEPTKETLTYPILEREDKFPVYYPSPDSKHTAFPTRREDTYHPTQYPVFISERVEPSYPPITHDVDLTSNGYPVQNDLGVHEYTVSTSLGHMPDVKAVTKVPATSSTFKLETPAVNLFSPPVETEGGFIPKGPGVIDEYYAVYPSTPSGPAVPHLTTSMQLDISKGECTSDDGRRVAEGDSISVGCLECTCAWAQLSCAPRQCRIVPGCVRLPPEEHAQECCGDLVCDSDNTTTTVAPSVTREDKNNNKVQVMNETSQAPVVFSQANISNTAKTNQAVVKNITTNTYNGSNPLKTNMASVLNTSFVASTTTAKPVDKLATTTTPDTSMESNYTSQEYEDDDDEGFSFGSVLKLLLSDSYESTTSTPYKKPATYATNPALPPGTSTSRPSTVAPFIPLPPRPYMPIKKAPNTVNRIDHLVLGEATAIKRTTLRPITNKTTKRPIQKTTTERRPEVKEESVPFTSGTHEGPRPPNLGGLQGVGPGLLKLAGCNIYGRMYRVGRIIAELSTPCQECWCTELGVQCKPLDC